MNVTRLIIIVVFLASLAYVIPQLMEPPEEQNTQILVTKVMVAKKVNTSIIGWKGSPRILRKGIEVGVIDKLTLLDKDQIETNSDSTLTIIFGYGAKVKILPDSEVLLHIKNAEDYFLIRKGGAALGHFEPEQKVNWDVAFIFPDVKVQFKKKGFYMATTNPELNQTRVAAGKGEIEVLIENQSKRFIINAHQGIVVGSADESSPHNYPWVQMIPWSEIGDQLVPEYEEELKVEKKVDIIDPTEELREKRKKLSSSFIESFRSFFGR